jgi:hypothetical protein
VTIIDDRTTNRSYTLPNQSNLLGDDVSRVRSAFGAVDADMAATLASLAGKASATHNHIISDIAGLQAALDTKLTSASLSTYVTATALTSTLGSYATTTSLSTGLAAKANTVHGHTATDITGLATIAMSGSYSDLASKPTLGTAAAVNTGLSAGQVPVMVTGGKYPAADGSLITGIASKFVRRYAGEYTASAALTTILPVDDTIPQITEGTEILSVSVVVDSPTQVVRLRWTGQVMVGGSYYSAAALFQDSTCVAAVWDGAFGVGTRTTEMAREVVPGAAGTYVFSVRVGPSAAGSVYLNGTTTGRYFGGVSRSVLTADLLEA